MVANPCPCGPTLRFGSQLVASIYLARAVLILIVGVILLILSIVAIAVVSTKEFQNTNSVDSSGREKEKNISTAAAATVIGVAGIGLFVVLSVAGGFSLALAILLWAGITKRRAPLLKTWCFVTLVLGGLAALTLLRELILGSSIFMTLSLVGLLFDAYAVWVVWAYLTELKQINIIQLHNGPTV